MAKNFVVIPEMDGRRLDYVIASFTDLSRQKARQIVEQGIVLVNDIRVTFPSKKVKKGDRITIINTALKIEKLSELDVIWEDDYVLVVNKPAGLLTEKIGSEKGVAVSEIFARKGKIVYPVHRLDRETSGVMVFAKTESSRDFLIQEFKEKNVKKVYIGVVMGAIKKKKGILKGILKQSGEYAETQYEAVKFLNNATMLRLIPKTGKTHQLRLQLAQIGHPVVGDKQYYDIKRKSILFGHQALHALKISFIHPQKKRWVSFIAPIPDDIKKLIKSLAF